jgi:hypothetical protein
VSPHLLSDPRIRAVLTQAGDLGGVVVELTERVGVTDQDAGPVRPSWRRPYVWRSSPPGDPP